MSQRTYSAKPADIKREWHIIDVNGKVLGRAASQIATLLKGKHKPTSPRPLILHHLLPFISPPPPTASTYPTSTPTPSSTHTSPSPGK